MPKRRSARRSVVAPRKTVPAHNIKRLPYSEVPAFLRALRKTRPDAAKDALEWLILTATRTNETLGARLSEVSAETATWTIPPERTATKRQRVMPLSARALEIFDTRKGQHSGQGDFMFESTPGRPLSSMAMLMQMRQLKCHAVPHGFRYTFHYWVVDRAKRREKTRRRQLRNGAAGKAEAAKLLEAGRQLMADWSAHCTSRLRTPRPRRNRAGAG
jgi:integrase